VALTLTPELAALREAEKANTNSRYLSRIVITYDGTRGKLLIGCRFSACFRSFPLVGAHTPWCSMARRSGRTSDDDDFGDDNDEDDDEERDSEDAGAAAKAVRAPPQPPAAFPMSVVTKAVVLAEQVAPPLSCHRLPSPVNY